MLKASNLHFCFLLVTLFISGCNQLFTNEQSNATITEKKEPPPELLTLAVDSKTVLIPIEKIDSIKGYLSQYHENERIDEIKRMHTTAFISKSGIMYGDIRYSCGVKLCDHTLVQIKNNEIISLSLHPGSIFIDRVFSPDERYLAVLLGKNEGTEIIRHSLKVINTESFSVANFTHDNDLVNQLTSSDFTIPILSISWENEKTLKATVPDTEDYKFETLLKWKQIENKTKEVFLTTE